MVLCFCSTHICSQQHQISQVPKNKCLQRCLSSCKDTLRILLNISVIKNTVQVRFKLKTLHWFWHAVKDTYILLYVYIVIYNYREKSTYRAFVCFFYIKESLHLFIWNHILLISFYFYFPVPYIIAWAFNQPCV